MAAMQLRGAPGDDVFRSASSRAATCAADTPSSARFKQGDDFWVVKREPGSERADLPIFAARAGAVDLAASPPGVAPTREDVAGAEGVFLVSNVLSGAECDAIVALSEAMGYTEDAPVSLGRDVRRNENCVWIADEPTLNGVVYARAAPLLPPFVELTSRRGDALRVGPLAGLNARWRPTSTRGRRLTAAHGRRLARLGPARGRAARARPARRRPLLVAHVPPLPQRRL